MMYTVQIGYKTDRLCSRTEKVFAETKEEAKKKMIWEMVLAENPMQIVFSGVDIARACGDRYVNKNDEICCF